MSTQLATEFATYMRLLPKLVAEHDGEFVVIKDEAVTHIAGDYASALSWGYDAYGFDSFFVKQVAADAGAVHLCRGFAQCQ